MEERNVVFVVFSVLCYNVFSDKDNITERRYSNDIKESKEHGE